MKCDKANEAMLEYMDKKIKPSKASALARHLMCCESCREYFVAFDEAMEASVTETVAVSEVPADFTDAVMSKVRALPPYQAIAPETTAAPVADILVRIFYGLCALILGAGLGVMNNREAVAAYLASHPGLSNALAAVGNVTQGLVDQVNALLHTILTLGSETAPDTGGRLIALAFVAVLAVAWFVLHRSEHANGSERAKA